MTTIDEHRTLIASFAVGAVKEAMSKGLTKTQAISAAQQAVISAFGLPKGRASLVCHTAFAQIEKLPFAAAINLVDSSERLLVINTGLGTERLTLTLAELLGLIKLVSLYHPDGFNPETPLTRTLH